MRVLHVLHQYLPDHVGGTEIYTQALASCLHNRGHRCAVFTRRAGSEQRLQQDNGDGVRVLRAVTKEWSPLAGFKATFGHSFLQHAFSRALSLVDPDVVHVHHLWGLPAAIPGVAKQHGHPVIATLHDYWLLCPNAQLLTNYDHSVCSGPRLWMNCARCTAARLEQPALNLAAPVIAGLMGWRARLLRRAIDSIDTFIAPTAFVRNLFAEAHLIPADRMTCVSHGIATEGVRPRAPRPAGAPLRVAYLGGISWQKGVHILLDAVMQLAPPQVSLKVYGDLTVFPRYAQRLVAQASGRSNIAFAGRKTRSEVWEALAHTDVLVVPSLWYETAALVIQESHAAGVPVIASDLGALQERVRHRMDGYLFPPGDAGALAALILKLATDHDRLSELRANIRPVVPMSQHVEEVLALYRRVLKDR